LYLAVLHLLYLSLRRVGRLQGLCAALLWLISVPVVQEVGSGNAQMEVAFWLLLGMVWLQKARSSRRLWHWSLAGLLLGLAALSRMIVAGVTVGLAMGLLFDASSGALRSRIRQLLPLLLTFAVVLSPWIIRNQMVFGAPVFGSSLAGYNLFRMNHIVAEPEFSPRYVGSDAGRQAVHSLIENATLSGQENEQEMQAFYAREGLRLILEHPLAYARLVCFRFLSLWFNASVKAAYGDFSFDSSDVLRLTEQLILLLAASAGAVRWRRTLWPYSVAILLACGGYMLVDAQNRYLVEVMPLIVSLAAVGVVARGEVGPAIPRGIL
jgi:4-amino-4-deoxy-L-arabinose transferase-like glycosyltransferase